MQQQPFVIDQACVPVECEDDSGVTWRTLTSADRTPTRELTTGVCEIAAGGALGLHRHPVLELYYFLDGTGVVQLGDVQHMVRRGIAISIPADAPHGVQEHRHGTALVLLRLYDRFVCRRRVYDAAERCRPLSAAIVTPRRSGEPAADDHFSSISINLNSNALTLMTLWLTPAGRA